MVEKLDIWKYSQIDIPQKISYFLHAFLEAYIIFYEEIVLSREENELFDKCRKLDIEKTIKEMISWVIPPENELNIILEIFLHKSFLDSFNEDYSFCTKNEFTYMYADCKDDIISLFLNKDNNTKILEVISYLRSNVYKMVENIVDKCDDDWSDYWVDIIQINHPEFNRFLDWLFEDNDENDLVLINRDPNRFKIIKEQGNFKLCKDNQNICYLIVDSDTYVLWKGVTGINSKEKGIITIWYIDWTEKIIDLTKSI